MAEDSSNSGITARYCILDGDEVSFQAWRTKAFATLDDADLEICKGPEREREEVYLAYDDENWITNRDEMDQYTEDIRSFRKRTKKAVMLLMGLVSEDIATALEEYERKPAAMWKYLKEEFDKVTSELKQLARQQLNSFKVNEKLPVRDIKKYFFSIIRACTHQNYKVSEEDQVMVLFAGISRTKYGMLKKLYFGQAKAPGISWIWARMGVDELDDQKDQGERDVEALVA